MRLKRNKKIRMIIVCALLALLLYLFLPKLLRGAITYLLRTELVSLQVENFCMGEDENEITIFFNDRRSNIIDYKDYVVKGCHYLKLYDGNEAFWSHGCFPNIDSLDYTVNISENDNEIWLSRGEDQYELILTRNKELDKWEMPAESVVKTMKYHQLLRPW